MFFTPPQCSDARLVTAGVLLSLSVASSADTFTNSEVLVHPTAAAFSVCFDHGCKTVAQLRLDETQWQRITQIFEPPPHDSAEERERIADAISEFETLVGPMTKTSSDVGGTLAGISSHFRQMDCIDESTNTTTYLSMLKNGGLMQWHKVEDRATRGFFIFGWPHTTAVIKDIQSNQRYAVDSWFHGNGIAPEVIDLATWRDGWTPEND